MVSGYPACPGSGRANPRNNEALIKIYAATMATEGLLPAEFISPVPDMALHTDHRGFPITQVPEYFETKNRVITVA